MHHQFQTPSLLLEGLYHVRSFALSVFERNNRRGNMFFKNTLKVSQLKLYCPTAVKYLPETNISTTHFRHL